MKISARHLLVPGTMFPLPPLLVIVSFTTTIRRDI